jgi:hypothetical protein
VPTAALARRRDTVWPSDLLALQQVVGNAAVSRLMARDGDPQRMVQRLVVNVNNSKLPALDAYNYTAMAEAFAADASQAAVEFAAADYRRDMRPADNVYFVGHGQAGTVGHYRPDQVVDALAHPQTGLPKKFTGTIISLSCSTGVKGAGGSAVRQIAEGLGAKHRGGVDVTGARGSYITHPGVGAGAIAPHSFPEALAYQNKHAGTIPKDFEDWKRLNPSATPKERAEMAAKMTKSFIAGFLQKADRKGWLIEATKTMKTKTSVAAPKQAWYSRLFSCLS